jgi:hypothetical protein
LTLTSQQQILSGALTVALWQQEYDELIAGLQFEEESFSTDRALAQQLQALGSHCDDALVSPFATEQEAAAFAFGGTKRCKVIGCTEKHNRHFCKVSALMTQR